MYAMPQQGTPGEDDGGPIDRGSTDTPSEQITAIVRARIVSGEYPAGSRVPSNTTLSQEFGVANRTVRKALLPLVEEGLIETKPGWGTFVARR
jgi:GntR family transcriptional regulator